MALVDGPLFHRFALDALYEQQACRDQPSDDGQWDGWRWRFPHDITFQRCFPRISMAWVESH
jgi:hypothetical protein